MDCETIARTRLTSKFFLDLESFFEQQPMGKGPTGKTIAVRPCSDQKQSSVACFDD